MNTTTRPRYVTAKDEANELRALTALIKTEEFKARSFHMSEKGDCFDAVLHIDGMPTELVEVKGRKGPSQRYDTWHIAQHKLDNLIKEANGEVDIVIVFTWDDGVFWWKWDGNICLRHELGGRTDRNDPYDQEPMVHIPRALFQKA